MIKDIAHCVAHNNRNRGLAYSYIEKFAEHFIEVAERGGMLAVDVLFPIGQVADQLASDAAALGISVDRSKLKNQLARLEAGLSDVLDKTAIVLRNGKVRTCRFEVLNDRGHARFAFVVGFTGLKPGVLTIPNNVEMAFPVLSS